MTDVRGSEAVECLQLPQKLLCHTEVNFRGGGGTATRDAFFLFRSLMFKLRPQNISVFHVPPIRTLKLLLVKTNEKDSVTF